ncbi:hypothetical protein BDQ17DRAFT_1419138 [Cyathus striatus]|nr:hypothetical protein BDQ17DRAFT_1419138 [Cyathus striatus]
MLSCSHISIRQAISPVILKTKNSFLFARSRTIDTRSFTTAITEEDELPEELRQPPKRTLKVMTVGDWKKLGIPEEFIPPKRPSSSPFPIFYVDFQKSQSESTGSVTMKAAAAAWKGLSEIEKKVYNDKKAQSFADYHEKMQQWYDSVHPDFIKRVKRTGRVMGMPSKRSDGIDRPLTSYFLFYEDFRQKYEKEHGKISFTDKTVFQMFQETAGETGKAWSALSQDEREAYAERSRKLLDEYKAKIEQLNLKNITFEVGTKS